MREIEIKAAYPTGNRAALETYLREQGYHCVSAEQQADDYYNHPCRDFVVTDEALRIRSIQDMKTDKEFSLLTYKGKNESEGIHTREELECEVDNGETARTILERLGFSLVAAVHKERTLYQKDDISICLDEVRGLGSYLEIEILCEEGRTAKTQKRLKTILAEIAFAEPVVEPETYLELLTGRKKGRVK